MGKKKKRSMWADGESSSSSSSSTGDKSTEESTRTRRRRTEARRNKKKKEGEAISMLTKLMEEKMSKLIMENHNDQCKRLEKLTESHDDLREQWDLMKDDISEIRKQLQKFTESHIDQRKRFENFTECHNDLHKQLELHTTGTSGDTSASLRSQLNQVQIPRYQLKFQTWQIGESVDKDQNIEISVALVDVYNGQTLQNGSLASAVVELVVVDANFNKNGNQYDWSREEFESSIIKKAQEESSAMRDVDQPLKSIVSNGRFKLVQGFKSHNGSTIFRNSSNKKIRLGVMVVSPTEERVLEGLSKPFLVRGHDRPGRKSNKSNRQRHALVDDSYQEPNGTMPSMQNPSLENSIQAGGISLNIIARQQEVRFEGNTTMQEPQDLRQYQRMEHARNNRYDGNESPSALEAFVRDHNFMEDDHVPFDAIGTEFNMDQIVLPVQLMWDRPNVEPSKHRRNLLDQFMPLHSSQTRRRGGVVIEPLEPDDSDDEGPTLKSKLHNKYRLKFVNKVCEAYYRWEQIKADDGNLLKVALFDENNMRITSGPLSSVTVEIVVLHGDFNVDGHIYWSSEEFRRCEVHPRPGEEASVLGGDRILVLADGEACLGDVFFQKTSMNARTGKFKMGVTLVGTQNDRVQEGISEPFRVRDHSSGAWRAKDGPTNKALPPGFQFRPTDEDLIVHYLCQRATAAPCSVPIIAEVDIYSFDPWELPAKAIFGEHEWYFLSPSKRISPDTRATDSAGYWKAAGTDNFLYPIADRKMLGIKKMFVFYKGRPPKGIETPWVMDEYSIPENNTEGSSSTSTMRLANERILCRIYLMTERQQLPSPMDDQLVGPPAPEFLCYADLPPGFRFMPTDKELIFHYLRNRATAAAPIIPEVDIYKLEPWDLPDKAAFGYREWYCFCNRGRRRDYASPNRATGSGYWEPTGTGSPILLSAADYGMHGLKNVLVFYKGRPPGVRTSWIMHEYCLNRTKGLLESTSNTSDEWVLCRIFENTNHHYKLDSSIDAPTYDTDMVLQLPTSSPSIDKLPEKTAPSEPGPPTADTLLGLSLYRNAEPRGPKTSAELVCAGCFTMLVYNHGASNIRCPHCNRVNSTRSGNQIGHLSCGHCRTTLAYPPGASTVGCPTCRCVNPITSPVAPGGYARSTAQHVVPFTKNNTGLRCLY